MAWVPGRSCNRGLWPDCVVEAATEPCKSSTPTVVPGAALPWRRPGSADYIVVYSYVILIPLQCAPFILYQDNGKPCLGHNIPYLIQMSLRAYSVFSCQAPGSFRHWPLGEVALLKVASSRSFSGATSLCRPGELSVRMLCICSLYNILYNRQNGDHQPNKGNCHICHRRGLQWNAKVVPKFGNHRK